MNNGLSGIKNIIWALAILICLLVLIIGLLITMVTKYYGDSSDGTLDLGAMSSQKEENQDAYGSTVQPGTAAVGSLNELVSTQDAGLEYVFNLTFLCDSTLSGVTSYGANFGSTASAQVWTDSGAGLSVANASSATIIYPNDGSEKTTVDAIELYQPSRLVIYIGGDDLPNTSMESFISGYTKLVQNIQRVSGGTKIICCSIASVSAEYPGSDGLSAQLIAQANGWIKQVCQNTGAYYADLATVLNDPDGYLSAEYADVGGRGINSAGINRIMEYFRMHGV